MTFTRLDLWKSRLQRAGALTRDIAATARAHAPRRHPARIGLICLIDLVQDVELVLPVAEAARAHRGFEVRMVMTDWLDRVAPAVAQRLEAAGFKPTRHTRDAVLTGAAPRLSGWDAVLIASESTAAAHRVGHALTKRAKAAGLATFTMQHGLENIGLTYRGDGDHDFASDWILTWGDPAALPAWVSPAVRARAIGVGRPESGAAPLQNLPLGDDVRAIVAVFENLHWERYDESYRARFVADLAMAAAARRDLLFVVRPHPAGQYLAAHAAALSQAGGNVVLVDPADAAWTSIRAVDLIARASCVITTPSTIALDAARSKRSAAVVQYGLTLEAYAPLPLLANGEDWRTFIDGALGATDDARLAAFRSAHNLEGDANAAILEAIAARVTPHLRKRGPSLRARAADKFTRTARALPAPVAAWLAPAESAPFAPAARAYRQWIKAHDTLTEDDRQAIVEIVAGWGSGPHATLILDTRGATRAHLERTLASVRRQIGLDIDIIVCGADAWAGSLRTARDLNDALSAARGSFCALITAGDELAAHALFTLAALLREKPDAVFAYSDEDRLDGNGRRAEPYFKPDWDSDLFLGQDFACRLALFPVAAARLAGGFGAGSARTALYSLLLRLSALSPQAQAAHAPFVLYHRAADPAQNAEMAAIARAETGLEVEPSRDGQWRVRRALPAPPPLISLIVPTRDRLALLRRCIDGLLQATDYPNLEVIIVDNQSSEAATLAYLDELGRESRVRVLRDDEAFNFSRLNNRAADIARGELIGLINNDIAVIEPGWLREMAGHAVRADVGAVGAMLLYPDGAIQHAGCTLGIGGVAAHLYRGLPADSAGHGGRLGVVQQLSAVTGACLLTSRPSWRAVGGFDERLPVAYNDIDYCLRLREAGLRILWTPFARLEHHESASRGQDESGDRRTRLERDKAFMRSRWGGRLGVDPFYSPNLTLSGTGGGLATPPRVLPPWRR